MTTASTSRDAIRFVILLTILFAIAAIAVRVTISVIENLPDAKPENTALLSFGILAITFAFMCIAGAIGVWAIRFTVVRESRRRIGRFVDELAPIHDGIMTVDREGRVIGSNPALRSLASKPVRELEPIESVFPCLSEADANLLLNPSDIQEIERTCQITGAPRSLRFRSQPAEDMHVCFVSDITHHRAEEQRREQIARFQLVGRIARGVAFDFNNLLCGIASHGALLRRLRAGSDELLKSAAVITRESERGITLSRHLLDLSHSGMAGLPTDRLEQYAGRSAELLRIALSAAWTVTLETEAAFDPVTLSGIQIEQVILNLGLLGADSMTRPGLIRITVNKPGADHLLNVKRAYAAILLISASASAGAEPPARLPASGQTPHVESESGIILSVVRTMVEECGGSLESFSNAPDQTLFRVLLPRVAFPSALEPETELMAFLSGLHILLAGRKDVTDRILGVIGRPNDTVIHEIHDAVGLLMKAETDSGLDVILIDQRLIGHEPDAFLRALMKLRPQAGIVILRDEQAGEPMPSRGVIVLAPEAKAVDLANAIIEAKGLAHRPR